MIEATDTTFGDEYAPRSITLRDGRRLTLRSIQPDDEDALQTAFNKLSPEARYRRFATPMKNLPRHILHRAVNPVVDRELALVAVDIDSGNAIVGGARYFADPDNQSCEFAVAIADDWHRCGLASCMLRELIQSARSRGLRRMDGFVLAGNKPM